MNNFLNNLNNRERNLIMAALLMVVTLILFFIVSNTIQSLNFSSKKLDKAKSDYEYVALKAQQLSNSLFNQSNDPAEIESFIDNTIDLDIKNLEVDYINNYLEGIDSIWMLPQHSQNITYMRTFYRVENIKIAPCIWDPLFIDNQINIRT